MSSSRGICCTLLFGLFATVGCDDGGSGHGNAPGGAGGKADDASSVVDPQVQAEHLEAVGACERQANRDREHVSALRIDARGDIERTRLECLEIANDATRSALALTLDRTAPSLADDVGQAFEAWRAAHGTLCSTLVDASEQALEKSSSVLELGCAAESELRLAEAVEAFVDLGGARAQPPTSEAAYSRCYDDYDDAMAADVGDGGPQGEAAELESTLADCVEAELEGDVEEIADRVAESFPGRDADGVADDVADRFEQVSDVVRDVCAVFGYGSLDAGEVQVARCRVAAAIWRHEVVGFAVPELGPRAPASPNDGDDGADGGPTDPDPSDDPDTDE